MVEKPSWWKSHHGGKAIMVEWASCPFHFPAGPKILASKPLPHNCSRFPIPDSRFPIPDSRFPIPDSRFPIPDSPFPELQNHRDRIKLIFP
ncbi:MAG: hypothetical protein F6K65_27005 [Moorea sp. SIO3C2]|nr:hypothetical protein [Moorena sp. SIO3C2]